MKQTSSILSTSLDFDGDDLASQTTLASATEEESSSETRACVVDAAHQGARLDRFLASALPEFSRSYVQQLLLQQAVQRLDPQPQGVDKPSMKVRLGEHYAVCLRPTAQSQAFRPELMDLDVVFEDDHLRVLHKPAGLVVHPAPGHWRGTLLNGLLALDDAAALLPRAGIVHRLDKDTSGLMVVARTRAVMDALVDLIAARQVHRQYLAVGTRAWQGPRARSVDAAIGRDPRHRLRMGVVDLSRQAGKTALTHLQCVQSSERACLVHCVLHTGRSHQIRVHMAHVGHPLLGDALYGGPMNQGIARQALHAYRLAFSHPVTQQPLQFEAPITAHTTPDLFELLAHHGLLDGLAHPRLNG